MQSNWEEIWQYVFDHKDQIHVFGSKKLGWIRVSWPGNSSMIYKSIHNMDRAKQLVEHALRYTNAPALMPKSKLN